MKQSAIPFGLFAQPWGPLTNHPPRIQGSFPNRCKSCLAFINRYCKFDLPKNSWKCVFCKEKNIDANLKEKLNDYTNQIYEYVSGDTGILSESSLPGIVFVVDGNLNKLELEGVKNSMKKALEIYGCSSRIGIISYTNVIHIYKSALNNIVSSYAINGKYSPDIDTINPILNNIHQYIIPIDQFHKNIDFILDTIISKAEPANIRKNRSKNPLKPTFRAFGCAIEIAMSLLGATTNIGDISTRGGKIIAFSGGAPNYGPGGVSDTVNEDLYDDYAISDAYGYYRDLSSISQQHDVSINILCGGLRNFQVSILQNLVMQNGGHIVMNKEFGPQIEKDLIHIFCDSIGKNGYLGICTSPTLNVTHIVGPAVQDEENSGEDGIIQWCKMANVSYDNTFTVYFDIHEDIIDQFVYFQIVSKFVNEDGFIIWRIITKSIATTSNFSDCIASLDIDVLSLLIAKKAVLMARKKKINENEVGNFVDEICYDILYQSSIKDKIVPDVLKSLPRSLFLLKMGPLLGPILQHPDDIEYTRLLFLNSCFEDSLRLLNPALLVAHVEDDQIGLVPLPLEDLALQSRNILVLDHHTDILIWSGSYTTVPEYDYIREFCLNYAKEVSARRFPQPEIRTFSEGESDARWLQCRLIPSHKDDMALQDKSFPQITLLSAAERSDLMSKFHRTDEISYNQYLVELFPRLYKILQ
eukprot:TRINITY_DN1463_c0_g1_i2.p1 TRINITY_DN1463_c0_g1~~TRINITY_DN1463_c0_g1_i2.p1  ORF type:complete len:696 (-),score=124.12 TRINITY_DN1463_c0_g1_i2:78-2165(-)